MYLVWLFDVCNLWLHLLITTHELGRIIEKYCWEWRDTSAITKTHLGCIQTGGSSWDGTSYLAGRGCCCTGRKSPRDLSPTNSALGCNWEFFIVGAENTYIITCRYFVFLAHYCSYFFRFSFPLDNPRNYSHFRSFSIRNWGSSWSCRCFAILGEVWNSWDWQIKDVMCSMIHDLYQNEVSRLHGASSPLAQLQWARYRMYW